MTEATLSMQRDTFVISFPFSQERDVRFDKDVLGAIRHVASTETLEAIVAYFSAAIAERKAPKDLSEVDHILAERKPPHGLRIESTP